jgi:hypothetical protein
VSAFRGRDDAAQLSVREPLSGRQNGYPVVTRHRKTPESLGIDDAVSRFGTEGSEVQILSPRPIPKKTCIIQAARSLGSSFGVESRNRVLSASNPAFIQNRSRFLASVRRDWSIPPPFASKVLPSTLPDCAVGH